MLAKPKYHDSRLQNSARIYSDGPRRESLSEARSAQGAWRNGSSQGGPDFDMKKHHGGELKSASVTVRKKKFRIRLPWA